MDIGLPETDSEDELPGGWEERTTLDDRVYYVNHLERSVQWMHPRTKRRKIVCGSLPSTWRRLVDNEGRAVFQDLRTGETTFSDPRLAQALEQSDQHAHPFPRQRFDARSTVMQVLHGLNLSEKTIFITGGTSGIGFEFVKAVVVHGASVIVACRNIDSARESMKKLKILTPSAKIDLVLCDLSVLESVKACADEITKMNRRIDIFVYNAAIFEPNWSVTKDGLEKTFCVNYLSHFYLTRLLWNRMKESAPARIVLTTCECHRLYVYHLCCQHYELYFSANFQSMPIDELFSFENLSPVSASSYSSLRAYCLSKLCCVLFAAALQDRMSQHNLCCVAVHPGNVVYTNLFRSYFPLRFIAFLCRPFAKTLVMLAFFYSYMTSLPKCLGSSSCQHSFCFFCN
ncbi:WW and adh short domain containing protein [Trichuris trichiura]|uniref:WW domain-containing oxidoreductase n=1 Tax=Trichuris trichiura TaxID=36087 RepID=A0A077YWN2_TRITR|nr:WW and adh short domain containing protein [Trichuris trichiura]